jgi:L-rhamnose isomerase
MLIASTIETNGIATAVVSVRVTTFAKGEESCDFFTATFDKITGWVVVHHEGESKRTLMRLENPDSKEELEETAIIAVLYCPLNEDEVTG